MSATTPSRLASNARATVGSSVAEPLRAHEFLLFVARMYGLPEATARQRATELLDALELRDASNYIRQRWTVASQGAASPVRLELFDGVYPQIVNPPARVAGEVDGSPVVAGPFFVAVEHPMATARVEGERIRCGVGVWEKPGVACRRSLVVGVAPPGQMRRGFLHYLERERPRPYAPFLHYNSWYDIAWGDRKMNEGQCLAVIDLFGRELIQKRGGKLDSLVFDDGWDDNRSLWRFHSGFPRGFTPLARCCGCVGRSRGHHGPGFIVRVAVEGSGDACALRNHRKVPRCGDRLDALVRMSHGSRSSRRF